MSPRETLQVHLQANTDLDGVEEQLRRLLGDSAGLDFWACGRNLEGCWGAGQFTVDLLWSAATPTAALSLDGVAGVERIDAVRYETVGSGLREPDIGNGIWRTLMLTLRPGVDDRQAQEFERELLQMPAYMPGMRNWRLARVTSPGSHWTHVWQQEYAAVDDLLGEYMTSPYHWGWVDRRFDPEFPDVWVVDTAISHAFCPLERSIIARRP